MGKTGRAALKAPPPAPEPEEDFEEGPSDEEEPSDAEPASGSGSDDDLQAGGSGSEGESDEDEDFGSDDGVEQGMGVGSGSEDEDEGEGAGAGAGSSDDGSGGSGDEGGGRGQEPGFLEGGKAASFAKAFAKILDTSGKKAAAVAGAAAGAATTAPILAASKSIAKRKVEEAEEAAEAREAKRLRQEMKQRGHVVPTKRGQDPAADAREKGLQRLATKGVVRLFNAISKAQRQLREAEEASGSRAKAVKLGKASFLAQLKGSAAAAGDGGKADQPLVPSAPRQAIPGVAASVAAAAMGGGSKRQQRQRAADSSSDEDEGGSGWDVLQQGFVGLQGGSKMKDWDRQESEDEGPLAGDQLAGMGGSSDDE